MDTARMIQIETRSLGSVQFPQQTLLQNSYWEPPTNFVNSCLFGCSLNIVQCIDQENKRFGCRSNKMMTVGCHSLVMIGRSVKRLKFCSKIIPPSRALSKLSQTRKVLCAPLLYGIGCFECHCSMIFKWARMLNDLVMMQRIVLAANSQQVRSPAWANETRQKM